MKRYGPLMLVAAAWLALLLSVGPAAAATATPPSAVGKWLGTMEVPGMTLHMGFEISPAGDGGYTAVFHSIDQGSFNIHMTSVTLKGDRVRLELADSFAYEGTLQPDGNTIVGNFLQGEATVPLVVTRVESFVERSDPQEPKKPYPYREEEVAYENPAAGVRIAGTLTIPAGKGPFPAVLLIGGSGPINRDGSLPGRRPFLILADHLTRQGVVVLRADKRGIGKTTGAYRGSGLKEFSSDAQAGVAYLRGRPEVAAQQVGLIGHSEGGEVASIVAAGSGDVAYVVLLGSPGLSFYDLMILQDGAQAKAEGKSDTEVELVRGFSRRFYGIVRRSKDAPEIERETQALYATLTEDEKRALGWPNLGGTLGLAWATAPGARETLEFDVGPFLRQIHCPVLALIGSKDCQVPPKENLSAIEAALKAGGNTDYTLRELPGLNHLFQTCTTGAASEYDKIDETIAPLTLQAISEWVLSHTRTAQVTRQ